MRLLQALGELKVETHLIVSRAAEKVISHELTLSLDEVRALASRARSRTLAFNPHFVSRLIETSFIVH